MFSNNNILFRNLITFTPLYRILVKEFISSKENVTVPAPLKRGNVIFNQYIMDLYGYNVTLYFAVPEIFNVNLTIIRFEYMSIPTMLLGCRQALIICLWYTNYRLPCYRTHVVSHAVCPGLRPSFTIITASPKPILALVDIPQYSYVAITFMYQATDSQGMITAGPVNEPNFFSNLGKQLHYVIRFVELTHHAPCFYIYSVKIIKLHKLVIVPHVLMDIHDGPDIPVI